MYWLFKGPDLGNLTTSCCVIVWTSMAPTFRLILHHVYTANYGRTKTYGVVGIC